jgi:hypothetical protein
MRVKVSMIILGAISLISLLAIHSAQQLRAADASGGRVATSDSRTPVLLELFTSEGCSDCPPADRLLQKFDQSQPVAGADLIVLSEHVDYWNDDGWRDAYSSRQYSERQSSYASQFGLSSVYTPQLVIDGRFQLVGSDQRQAILAIEKATKAEKVPVSVSSIKLEAGNVVVVHVDAGALPSSSEAKTADVLIGTADESDESHVSSGENARRTLRHIAVLRSLTRVAKVNQAAGYSGEVSVNLNPASAGNLRLIAIVQEPEAGKVLGAGSARISR